MTKVDNKLKVIDAEHFQNLCICLDRIKDDFDDSTLSFNDDQPIIDFENGLNFFSLRAKVESDIIAWENSLDKSPNPEDQYLAPVSLMAMLNVNCEIYIGDELANACDNQDFSIVNPDFANTIDGNEVETRNGWCLISDCCPINQELERFIFPNDSGRRIKLSVFSYHLPWPWVGNGNGTIIGGKITSQKYRSNKWKRSRQEIAILGSGGIYRNYNWRCNQVQIFNNYPQDYRKRKSRN